MKNVFFDELTSGLDMAKGRFSELEDVSIEPLKTKNRRE